MTGELNHFERKEIDKNKCAAMAYYVCESALVKQSYF